MDRDVAQAALRMQPEEHELKQLPILAVADDEPTLIFLARALERAGHANVHATADPREAPALFGETRARLVLLDLHMDGMDGFELMERLGPVTGERRSVPFLVLTTEPTEESKRRALSLGARDFLIKPLDRTELLLRVRNVLQVQQLQDRLFEQNANFELEVAERTRDLEQARLEVLDRLALGGEYLDDDTREHARRIGRTCALIAIGLGVPDAEVELISRAAPLHDIGKIGIPDAILLKPGKLTQAEFEQIKRHTTIGADILSGSRSRLLRMAESIALTHHERWDGSRYPLGLAGEEIPLAGRIVAVADVFDALTHERPYKEAWSISDAVAEIVSQSGRQFDPAIVEAFTSLEHAALLTSVKDWKPSARPRLTRSRRRLATHA
jgi:putative two-component system response regulator